MYKSNSWWYKQWGLSWAAEKAQVVLESGKVTQHWCNNRFIYKVVTYSELLLHMSPHPWWFHLRIIMQSMEGEGVRKQWRLACITQVQFLLNGIYHYPNYFNTMLPMRHYTLLNLGWFYSWVTVNTNYMTYWLTQMTHTRAPFWLLHWFFSNVSFRFEWNDRPDASRVV